MHSALSTLLLLGTAAAAPSLLTGGSVLLSPPIVGGVEKRGTCNRDNLLRLFVDARYSSSASAFCSGYITGTATAIESKTATVTTTLATVTVTSVVPPAADAVNKRAFTMTPPNNAITYGASRLSSACSCIVTAPSEPNAATRTTTVATETTSTVPTATATVTAVCGPEGHYDGSMGEQGPNFQPSFAACKDSCAARSGCQAFVYGTSAGANVCWTFLDDVTHLRPDGVLTSWRWYDAACPVEIPVTPV